MPFRLLDRFRELFEGNIYRHRDSSLGDSVAQYVPEDLLGIDRSEKLTRRIIGGERVINVQNRRRGIDARRGDGSFGEIVPGEAAIFDPGFSVGRGPVATIEIGAEVKILAKAMTKQRGRVMSDLEDQVKHFNRGGDRPICVAIVGVNYAHEYLSYEGEREFLTDGRTYKHPVQEAADTEHRIRQQIAPLYDELVVLRFRATNMPPFQFEWVNERETTLDYGASLARMARQYDQRF